MLGFQLSSVSDFVKVSKLGRQIVKLEKAKESLQGKERGGSHYNGIRLSLPAGPCTLEQMLGRNTATALKFALL